MVTTRFLACICAAGALSMAAAPVADAKVIRFQRVPEGRVPAIPANGAAPRTIRASSRIDGIHLSRGPKRFRDRGNPQAFLHPTKAAAREFEREGFVGEHSVHNGGCFTVIPPGSGRGGRSFPSDQNNFASVWAESKSKRRVSIVREQRFVPGPGDDATLHVTDAYVDAVSLGAKLIDKGTVKMKRVAKGPGGIAVYAAREGSKVHFVVSSATDDDLPERAADMVRGIHLISGFNGGSSSCGFLYTTMDADTMGGGTAATVSMHVPLGVETSEVEPRGSVGGAPHRKIEITELALRPAGVRLSVSQTSSDRVPVVSVGFGWEGKTQRQRI